MNGADVKPGIRIKTASQLADTSEAEVCSWLISRRSPNKSGNVLEPVKGFENLLWIVSHGDGAKAVYSIHEFEPA